MTPGTSLRFEGARLGIMAGWHGMENGQKPGNGEKMENQMETLAHQNRTIAIASDFRVDGAKSPEIPQQEGVLGSEIAARNRRSLATFHRTLKSQCSIAVSSLGNRCDFWGLRLASQSQIAKIAAISVRQVENGPQLDGGKKPCKP